MNNESGFGYFRNSFSRLFYGTTLKDKQRDEEQKIINKQTIVAVENDDAADLIDISNFYSSGYLTQQSLHNQVAIINEYRGMAIHAEVDRAIDDIINEAVTSDADVPPVELVLNSSIDLSDSIKDSIEEEWDYLMRLLKFDLRSYEIVRQFYVDGRLYYHKIIDPDNTKKGILKLINLDPRATKKIKEIISETDPETRIERIVDSRSYFLYDPTYLNEMGSGDTTSARTSANRVSHQPLELSEDTIAFIHSGMLSGDTSNNVMGYLEKARKPLNNLRMLEDAVVIYRITRAPERRIFYVDVGTLPKKGAEEYMNSLINKYKTKLVYDGTTGTVKGNSHQVSMMEDYWLPRREGGKGTEISTLDGGCLAMDTYVPLLDGRELTIAELTNEYLSGKQNWTYSVNKESGEIVPGIISWAGVTQKSAKVMKLTFDNGETLTCTPDHEFPIFNKGFVRADALIIGESMIPFNTRNNFIDTNKKLDYTQVYQPNTKTWDYTHRMVGKNIHLPVFEYIKESNSAKSIIHHKDFDRYNNDPTNLCRMDWYSHGKYHADNGFSPEAQRLGTLAAAKWLEELKKDKVAYLKYQNDTSVRFTEWHGSLTPQERMEVNSKISSGICNYIKNQTDEEILIRSTRSTKNLTNAMESTRQLLVDNPELRDEWTATIQKGWDNFKGTYAYYNRNTKISNCNSERMQNPEYKEKVFKNQRIKFDVGLLNMVREHMRNTIALTGWGHKLKDVCVAMNDNIDFINLFNSLNENTRCANYTIGDGFTPGHMKSMVKKFNYTSWKHFKEDVALFNHQLISIEYLDNEIEVGTLTIDNDEEFHGHHTFALSIGIFTKNSNLGQIEDLKYFQKNLLKSLNVPQTRLESEATISIGNRATEINRDELKFNKFIQRIRRRFNTLFLDLLRTQLILKGITTAEDWDNLILPHLTFEYASDVYVKEESESMILEARLSSLAQADPYVGKYFTREDIMKNILRMDDEEIKAIDKTIKEEIKAGYYPDPMEVFQLENNIHPKQIAQNSPPD